MNIVCILLKQVKAKRYQMILTVETRGWQASHIGSLHDQITVTEVHIMHKLIKKHAYILKAIKLARIHCGWLVINRTPSIKMLYMNFYQLLLTVVP